MQLFQDQIYNLSIPSADVSIQRLYSDGDGTKILEELKTNINWQQEHLRIYGKDVPLPRLTAWHGVKNYTYSGITSMLQEWTPQLLKLKADVEERTGYDFNGVFLNWYRDGKDSISWHSDDEPELGDNPVIASVSLGSTRAFQLRSKFDKRLVYTIDLYHGSLLLMGAGTQKNFLHQVPKTKNVGDRINLTFRKII
jgi:alkylated DNA repair dioxygenase AlkB